MKTIKDLKKAIENLPDEMGVMIQWNHSGKEARGWGVFIWAEPKTFWIGDTHEGASPVQEEARIGLVEAMELLTETIKKPSFYPQE